VNEAVFDAPGLPRPRGRKDAAKLKALRRHIQTGLDDFARGDFVEVDAADLERFFAELTLDPETPSNLSEPARRPLPSPISSYQVDDQCRVDGFPEVDPPVE